LFQKLFDFAFDLPRCPWMTVFVARFK